MNFEIGDTVDAYQITGVVGRGGMGRVYQVEHTVTKRVEAMKVVIGGQPDSEEHARRFLREIQLQARLSHPNIASVYNAFWLNGDLVLVMELVEGPSLQDVLEAGPIPLATGIDYARQALHALRYAHANGIVHRDVSPGNILIAPGGTVKLTDFGLAKALAGPRYTKEGEALGSVYYASPEQLKGLPTVDERTDIYSLGAVLYEIATGRTMFDADSLYDVMTAQIEQTPPAPAERNPEIPPALSEIILTALAKNPAQRFRSADAFLDALEKLPRAPSGKTPERKALRVPLRNAVPIVFGVVVLATLALAVWNDVSSRNSFAREAAREFQQAVEMESPPKAEHSSGPPPEVVSPVAAEAAPVMPPPKARPVRRSVGTRLPSPMPAPAVTVQVEPAPIEIGPVEIASGPVEPPPAVVPEIVPDVPAPPSEVKPKPARHWLWRALGKIPLPGGRKRPASDQSME